MGLAVLPQAQAVPTLWGSLEDLRRGPEPRMLVDPGLIELSTLTRFPALVGWLQQGLPQVVNHLVVDHGSGLAGG